MTSSRLNIVLGAGPIGDSSDAQAKFTTPQKAQEFISLFRKFGHTDLDTARGYSPAAPGSSEALLSQTDAAQWATIDTKVTSWVPGSHSASKIEQSIKGSLEALRMEKVHIMYLHAPDRETPFEETCEAMDKAYRARKFEKFGISNYSPKEVEQILKLCEEHGWVKPSVYQGQYNAIARLNEDELLPLLRKHGLSYYAYRCVHG